MKSQRISLACFSRIEGIEGVEAGLERILGFEISTFPEIMPVPSALERGEQLYANDFLGSVAKVISSDGANYGIGVTERDLFVPELNFVFGLANPLLRAAVVSTARLAGKNLEKRLLKEVLHEFGHLSGIRHCEKKRCVMSFSNSLADVDRKPAAYCTDCRRILNEEKAGGIR